MPIWILPAKCHPLDYVSLSPFTLRRGSPLCASCSQENTFFGVFKIKSVFFFCKTWWDFSIKELNYMEYLFLSLIMSNKMNSSLLSGLQHHLDFSGISFRNCFLCWYLGRDTSFHKFLVHKPQTISAIIIAYIIQISGLPWG